MINKASFYDNNGNKCYASIELESESLLVITAYNSNADEIGGIQLIIDKRIYLGEIICDSKYHRRGIGTALIDIFEYLYRDYKGIVFGKYLPFNIALNSTQNDEVARSFYNKNGYQIVSKREYLKNKELYKELTIEDFAHTSRMYDYSLIYKKSLEKDNYRFIEKNNELVEKEKVKSLFLK